ncbi:MAG TPA: cytochrome c biogenesis protein ResB [Candidatus Hydrogenedentes bacterium]|nr:cytochrome c biogenesis protein ResB [Candidatus Hydrogenedentota bacterium]
MLQILSSYALGIATLFLLLVLTYLGTLEQIEHGLFATQQKYFNSLYVIHEINGIPLLPLPGVYTLLFVLGINMLLGAITRFRWGMRHAGVFVVHTGILIMLLGGFVTYHYSVDGHLTLYEGETSDEFLSYYDWEITIAEDGVADENDALVIPGDAFRDLTGDNTRSFSSAKLPFTMTLSGFMPNAVLMGGTNTVTPIPRDAKNERNVAGITAQLAALDGSTKDIANLWGMSSGPYRFQLSDKSWNIALQRRRWKLPFAVGLDKFTRVLHPGTAMPSAFSSDVTVVEPVGTQKVHISMNRPLRYKGYTLFQASWGPTNAGPQDKLFSTLAVVRNPADQFPLYGFVVITLGLLFHFTHKLFLYLRSEAVRQ